MGRAAFRNEKRLSLSGVGTRTRDVPAVLARAKM
jgi:hypothetical protein